MYSLLFFHIYQIIEKGKRNLDLYVKKIRERKKLLNFTSSH